MPSWIDKYAVLTGDLVGFKAQKKEHGDKCLEVLKESLKIVGKNYVQPFLIFRGDSFQGITSTPENALKDTIMLRLLLIKDSPSDLKKERMDARIAVGVGIIDFLPDENTRGEADGEAFRYSGKALDAMEKNDDRIALSTPWPDINDEYKIMCHFIDEIIGNYTKKQAEVVYLIFDNLSQQEISKELGITQSAVSKRLKDTNHGTLNDIIIRYSCKVQEQLRLPDDASKEKSEAMWYIKRGNIYALNYQHDIALDYFNKALKLAQEAGDSHGEVIALSSIARVYGDIKEFEKAIKYCKIAINIDSNYLISYFICGNSEEFLERYEEALKNYDTAIEKEPLFFGAYLNRANIKGKLKRYGEALKDYDKAIELNPNYAEAYNNRGTLKVDLKQYEEALKDYDKAIELNPNYAEAYNNRGSVKAELKEYDDAIKDLDRAIEINPNLAEILKTKKEIEEKMKEEGKKVIVYNK